LPIPARGGSINELQKFLNAGSDDNFILIVAWLIMAMFPDGPFPVLIIIGESGSGKTFTCRILRKLIDPSAADLRSPPRTERDLFIAAKNSRVVAFDNLSYLRNDLSDALCSIATKGGFATRQLYTDDEEAFFEVCRPLLLNGIPALAERADLADRALTCLLPRLPEEKRRPEEEIEADFTEAAPRLLGALLDGLSGALQLYPTIQLKGSYRMLDFAKRMAAACQALGAKPGAFEAAYERNRRIANEDAVDADEVAIAIIDLMKNNADEAWGPKNENGEREYPAGEFLGTATALLVWLELGMHPWDRPKGWPKNANQLGIRLRRAAKLLRERGIDVVMDERTRGCRAAAHD
jgi:hypothetical protein